MTAPSMDLVLAELRERAEASDAAATEAEGKLRALAAYAAQLALAADVDHRAIEQDKPLPGAAYLEARAEIYDDVAAAILALVGRLP